MTKKNVLLMAGLAVFTFTSSQALAFSEEEMIDGMTLSVQQSQKSEKSYKNDNSTLKAQESMTEFVFFPDCTDTIEEHYAGDCTCPSGEHMMSEGLYFSDSSPILAAQ